MIETLEFEETAVEHYDAPKLQVEWSSPWREFVTSIRPALVRSERRLAGEAPFGLIPLRIMIPSYVLEAFLIFAVIVVQLKIAQLQPFVAPRFSSHDVIYYSGDELPRTEDLGGSQAGNAGRAGGGETQHRVQTIKIARGSSLVPKVVDAPNLKLPSSRDAVANLLAVQPNPGPPPSQGLRSTRTAPTLTSTFVAPAPNVIRDYTRNAAPVESVIAPAPSVSRDQPVTAPNLSATLIPPTPTVARDHSLVAPALDPTVVPPAPSVTRERAHMTPALIPSVVAPAPSISQDRARSAPSLAPNVIPAAPAAVGGEFSHRPVQMIATAVPPPVSAPERTTSRNPKLNLPAPSVIAPPPSANVLPANVSPAVRQLAGGAIPDSSRTVVPPPPTATGSGSFMSNLMGKIFGASEVVPPPPSVHSNNSSTAAGTLLGANVVPPPPAVAAAGSPHGARNGMGPLPGPNVIAPPLSTGISGANGTRPLPSSSAPTLGVPSVVAPPPTVSANGAGAYNSRRTLADNNVVAPPPSVDSSHPGLSRTAPGPLGVPPDAVTRLTPPNASGSDASAGAVLSSQPGPKVGLPNSKDTGSLAVSPSGGDKPGLGGAGNGASIGHGNGPGSAMNGAGSGAAKATEAGRGSDAVAHNGISPTPGPGGAGNASSGTPPVRGIDISGGSGIVNLPSFGSDSTDNNPSAPGHSTLKQREALGVTIVATATSGGAFEPYKNLLRGEKYTTYFDTSLGTVVMEFSDEAASAHSFGGTLTAPSPLRADLAQGLPHARIVLACTLDASGNLRNVRVLEPGPAEMTAKIVAALRSWKFQPAMRGNQPVAVTAILGFGIDTNDRF